MSPAFASPADPQDKKIRFSPLSHHDWADTAEGGPGAGHRAGELRVRRGAMAAARSGVARTTETTT